MKVLLLAGGFGTRFSEATDKIPKPMIPIGGEPILWHIMKMYAQYGFDEFVVLLGYKGYLIKEYFANYFLHKSDVTIDLKTNGLEILNNTSEPWKITLLDTGLNSMTGGRVLKAKEVVGNDTFLLSYGDGVGDVNFKDLLEFHKSHGKAATMTTYQPNGRFGGVSLNEEDNSVAKFMEKPKGDGRWINIGFFVCEAKVFDYICNGAETVWENEPLEKLAEDNELYAYQHHGFWKPMDTLRDHKELNDMWSKNEAKWKTW
ncbi:glucose-1-phosphate cytidylyltransferase [Ochrovirga pacifica]|uniref:glucose-1-phosphate cytidylyltransferase n=1 Tax=Ochrovirga pacifica TaxID=1042376 RepID=UPI0002559DC2|nr:glucose-1-phosphate cytidylyltransferase [Ochrovirga pacifica]